MARKHSLLYPWRRLPARYVELTTQTPTPWLSSIHKQNFELHEKRLTARQTGGSSTNEDPIADTAGCQRDVAEFQKLGINTVRVYSIDNSQNHDACMEALANAGIYLALDVNTPYYSLNRASEQAVNQSYNEVYLQSVFATVDMFSQYDNTLLFFSANEVINADNNSFTAPYIKAVTRDIKAYIQARGYRDIPVGYSAADIDDNRYQMATYMNCGPDQVRSDFFAFNDYSWCDPSSFQQSGWAAKVQQYSNYSIPLFLSEYGCNTNTRTFEEVGALFNSEMTGVYSGGLVYEYSQESNNYGLVEINGNNVTELPDFTAYQSALANATPPSGNGGYLANGAASACPPTGPAWSTNTTDLPQIPAGAVKFFSQGAGKGPGNDGSTGSQTAGTPSTGWVADTANDTAAQSGSGSGGSGKKSGAALARPAVGALPAIGALALVFAALL